MDHYKQASRVLHSILTKRGSLKQLALNDPTITNPKFITALVSETLKHKHFLDTILKRTHLQHTLKQQIRDPSLLLLLLYDLLFSKKQKIMGGGQVKRALMAHEAALRKAAEGMALPPGVAGGGDGGGAGKKTNGETGEDGDDDDFNGGGGAIFPRYARINMLKKMTVGQVKAQLVASGVVKEEEIKEDEHIPNLLVLPRGTDVHAHELVKKGVLVLQDKVRFGCVCVCVCVYV